MRSIAEAALGKALPAGSRAAKRGSGHESRCSGTVAMCSLSHTAPSGMCFGGGAGASKAGPSKHTYSYFTWVRTVLHINAAAFLFALGICNVSVVPWLWFCCLVISSYFFFLLYLFTCLRERQITCSDFLTEITAEEI